MIRKAEWTGPGSVTVPDNDHGFTADDLDRAINRALIDRRLEPPVEVSFRPEKSPMAFEIEGTDSGGPYP